MIHPLIARLPVLLLVGTIFLPAQVFAAGGEVMAEVAGQKLTRADLEEHVATALAEIDRQRHLLLETGLTELIDQRLLAEEAKRRGQSLEALLVAEAAAVPAVSDEDVESWYEQNQARVRQPKERIADQIRAFLTEQRVGAARRQLITKLRGEHEVQVFFEPLRFELDVAGAPAKGPAAAPVTIVEYSDFQCPGCRGLQPELDRLTEAYGERVRLVFKHFPLHSIHPEAQKAAEASLCAQDQDKFWEMHDAMFANQRQLGVEQLKQQATTLGLDGERFAACLDSGAKSAAVLSDVAGGREIGINQTPSLFVNGRPINFAGGRSPFEVLSEVVDRELGQRQGS